MAPRLLSRPRGGRFDPTRHESRRQLMLRVLLGGAFTATGAALVAYLLTGLPLVAGLAGTVGLAAGTWLAVWRRLTPAARVTVARRARIGLIAGVPAIIGYDLGRHLLVSVTGSVVNPFEAWPLFGELLGAGPHTTTAALAVGFGYHVLNGLGFAVAYAIVLGHRGVFTGIAWALVLETAMVSLYPGWLELKALDEFLSVTIFGHVIYGAVLGAIAKALIGRDPLAQINRPEGGR